MTTQTGNYLQRYPEATPWKVFRNKAVSITPTESTIWTDYAYCQYVTTVDYLCNSLMIFESLQNVRSKAARVMMFPQEWVLDETTEEGRLLSKARDDFHVVLQPIEVQHFKTEEEKDNTWSDSFTKLLAFNLTSYKRVLSLDSDATVLQSMDELFLLPPSPVAMPRAYWLPEKPTLSSQLVLVQPSELEMNRVLEAFQNRSEDEFDMEIVNNLYGSYCTVLPHRRYDLLSGEFRNEDHHLYLGSKEEPWDPNTVYEEAKFIHFSDWPLPKPWKESSQEERDEVTPKCRARDDGTEDCRDRDMWLHLYEDFLERRERVCGSYFLPGQRPQEFEGNVQQLAWDEAMSTAE